MADELFDNGIDGTDWGDVDDGFLQTLYDEGGTLIHHNSSEDFMIVYYAGQWNDSGNDPDCIIISLGKDEKSNATHTIRIETDRTHFYLPDKDFEIEGKIKLKDLVDIQSPINIDINNFHFPDLIDALSNKMVVVNFSKEIFLSKIERFRNLLVFG